MALLRASASSSGQSHLNSLRIGDRAYRSIFRVLFRIVQWPKLMVIEGPCWFVFPPLLDAVDCLASLPNPWRKVAGWRWTWEV